MLFTYLCLIVLAYHLIIVVFMESIFTLRFEYAERNYELKSRFLRLKDAVQFHINHNDLTLIFESPKNSNEYDIVSISSVNKELLDVGFIQAISHSIKQLNIN